MVLPSRRTRSAIRAALLVCGVSTFFGCAAAVVLLMGGGPSVLIAAREVAQPLATESTTMGRLEEASVAEELPAVTRRSEANPKAAALADLDTDTLAALTSSGRAFEKPRTSSERPR